MTAANRCWGVLPVKGFDQAKSRLAPVLPPAARVELAIQLFQHVLDVMLTSTELEQTWVATNCADVARRARGQGARVLMDAPQAQNLGQVTNRAIRYFCNGPANHLLLMMADLPYLHGNDIRALVHASKEHDMVLAPDRHDGGTNALHLRLSPSARACFGHEDSLRRHKAMAANHNMSQTCVQRLGLAFDLDAPEDYRAYASLANTERGDRRNL